MFERFKPKTPKWLDNYLEEAYGTTDPQQDFSHLRHETPNGIEPKYYEKALEIAAGATVPPAVRARVEEVVVDTTKSPGMLAFENKLEKDSQFQNAVNSLSMVGGLLAESYISLRNGESLNEMVGTDPDNLHQLMRAAFSKLQGRVVEKKEIVGYLSRKNMNLNNVLYYEVLGLGDASTPDEVDAKCHALQQVVYELDDLASYPNCMKVIKAMAAAKHPNYKKLTMRQIVTQLNIPTGGRLRFDETRIQEMLTEAEKSQKQRRYEAFFKAHQSMPAIAMLGRLGGAFHVRPDEYAARYKDAYFGGQEAEEVAREIDSLFPDVPGLGRELLLAATTGSDLLALVRVIDEKMQRPETLEAKLAEIHRVLGRRYHVLLAESDPYKRELEDEGKPEINFGTFWREAKNDSDPEVARAFSQLWQLHFALRRTEDQYNEKNRDVHFNGDEQAEFTQKFVSVMGAGLAASMQLAADAGNGAPYQYYALMEVIAHHYQCTKRPEQLKRELKRIGRTLSNMYPNLGI
ncbi:hypothetical protein JXD20_02345 [Candidatus Peregrinibacteria bacterium]|nr:hypothetical protein [Candidatus Peregrinibacteria bacterium]